MGKNKKGKKAQHINYNDMYIDDVLAPKQLKKVKKGDVKDADESSDTITRAATKAAKQAKKDEAVSVEIKVD